MVRVDSLAAVQDYATIAVHYFSICGIAEHFEGNCHVRGRSGRPDSHSAQPCPPPARSRHSLAGMHAGRPAASFGQAPPGSPRVSVGRRRRACDADPFAVSGGGRAGCLLAARTRLAGRSHRAMVAQFRGLGRARIRMCTGRHGYCRMESRLDRFRMRACARPDRTGTGTRGLRYARNIVD